MIFDPHDPSFRRERFRKSEAVESYFKALNQHLEGFGGSSVLSKRGENFPVIYIVGLPRSGTTLLSQLLSRYLEVGYINNLIARFWLNPVVGISLSREILGLNSRKNIQFKSLHGVTEEPWGPHEFGYFWRHWLNLDLSDSHKLSPGKLSEIDQAGLLNTLNAMAGAFEAPLVFKNVICGFQAEFLSKLRANSLFVLIERDPDAVARSLLRCRKERYGDPSVWWSLKPSSFKEIKKIESPEEQIARQIEDGREEFGLELSKSSVASVKIRYEDLCSDPEASVQAITQAIGKFGVKLDITDRIPSLNISRST